jgi:hypothetical protein
MEVQRVPRAELLHGNLRVSLYGPRSTEYQTQMEQMESCRPNHVESRWSVPRGCGRTAEKCPEV